MTENHQYNTPKKGATDWHIPLNENFERLDNDVEVRDLESNLGSYAPGLYAKFLAVDTGAVYIGDGSAWNKLGVIGDGSGAIDGGSSDDGSSDDGSSTGDVIVADPADLSNWTGAPEYFEKTGDTAYFDIETDNPLVGNSSIHGYIPEGENEHGDYPTIVRTDGPTIQPGDTFRADLRIDSEYCYAGITWGVQAESGDRSGYRYLLDNGLENESRLEVVNGDGTHDSASMIGNIKHKVKLGEVYTVEITWQTDGYMPFRLIDESGTEVARATESDLEPDTSYTSGYPGVLINMSYKNHDKHVYVDDFRVV